MDWQRGVPPKHGYYLAAWQRGDRVVVSELWYNPDARPKWWLTRGYIGERSRGMDGAVNYEVVGWMPMPEPPRDDV